MILVTNWIHYVENKTENANLKLEAFLDLVDELDKMLDMFSDVVVLASNKNLFEQFNKTDARGFFLNGISCMRSGIAVMRENKHNEGAD